MAEKPKFDPSQPFQEASADKPAFDPGQPFEPADGMRPGERPAGKKIDHDEGLSKGGVLGTAGEGSALAADNPNYRENLRGAVEAGATMAPLLVPGVGALAWPLKGLVMAGAGGVGSMASEPIAPSANTGEMVKRARNVALTAGASELLPALAPALGRGAAAADRAAGTQFAKAAADTRGSSRQIKRAVGGPRALQEAGTEGVERGLIRPIKDQLPGGAEDARRRVFEELERSGKGIEKSLKAADQLGFGPKPEELKGRILEATKKVWDLPEIHSAKVAELQKLEREIDAAAKANNGIVPPTKLQDLKEATDEMIRAWDPTPGRKVSPTEKMRQDVYGVFKQAQEDAAGQVPGALEAYKKEKRSYEIAKDIKTLHGFADARTGDFDMSSRLTQGAGGLGFLLGGPVVAAKAYATGKAIQGLTSPTSIGLGMQGAGSVGRFAKGLVESPSGPVGIRALLQAILAGQDRSRENP